MRPVALTGIAAMLLMLALSACSGTPHALQEPSRPEDVAESARKAGSGCSSATPLTVSPIDPASIHYIVPLGNLNPTGHVFPTSHTYMYVVDPDRRSGVVPKQVPVRSPGDVRITSISKQSAVTPAEVQMDYAMELEVCGGIRLVFIHLGELSDRLTAAIDGKNARCEEYVTGGTRYRHCSYFKLDLPVRAGEPLGLTSQRGSALDFGAYDLSRPELPFARPDVYYNEARYNVCPYDLYGGELRQTFAELIRRAYRDVRADHDCGAVNQDLPGTAKGNWFKDPDRPFPEDPNLALVRDVARSADRPVFSVGTSQPGMHPGVYRFEPRAEGRVNREFHEVLPDQVYCYESLSPPYSDGTVRETIVLVRLASKTELLVEVLPREFCGLGPWTMSEAAVRYRR